MFRKDGMKNQVSDLSGCGTHIIFDPGFGFTDVVWFCRPIVVPALYWRWLIRSSCAFAILQFVPCALWLSVLPFTVAASRSSFTFAFERLIGIFWITRRNFSRLFPLYSQLQCTALTFVFYIGDCDHSVARACREELRDAATVKGSTKSHKAHARNCKMAKTHQDRISQRRYSSKIAKRHRCTEGITSREITVRHSPLVSPLVSIIIIFFWSESKKKTDKSLSAWAVHRGCCLVQFSFLIKSRDFLIEHVLSL